MCLNNNTTTTLHDIQRLTIYVNVQGNPITLSLAGMKLKRKDLMWQLDAWCLAFVIGIVKTIVLSNV